MLKSFILINNDQKPLGILFPEPPALKIYYYKNTSISIRFINYTEMKKFGEHIGYNDIF